MLNGRLKHIFIIASLVIILTIFFYLSDIPALGSEYFTEEFFKGQIYQEICLLAFAPILIYSSVFFRIKGVIIITIIFSFALLPHAFLFSPYPDPIFREASFSLISLLLGGLIANQLNHKELVEKEQDKLKHYTLQTLKAQESERLYLSHELHDETAQELVDISHDIDSLIENHTESSPEIHSQLTKLRIDVDSVVEGTRRFIQGLRPPLLEELGLLPSIRWLAEQTEMDMDIQVKINSSIYKGRLSSDVELNLFRIAQEVFTNIEKHSRASLVNLNLEYSAGIVLLTIEDNGIGFYPPSFEQLEKEGKYGLLGITERAQLVGGSADIKSTLGVGTTFRIKLPVLD